MVRFQRQTKLSQIGEKGQERLLSARLTLGNELDPATRAAATLYAERAGFGNVSCSSSGLEETALPYGLNSAFRHAPSRAIGLGAALVLAASLPLFELPSAPVPPK